MFILCFVLWMILNGRITWEIAGFGIAVSAAVSWAARRLTGVTLKKELTIFRRFPAVLAYAGYLLREIVRANFAVIRRVYGKKASEGCLKTFSAPLETTAARVALADSITLTPGTISAGLEESRFTVHCLDRSMSEGLEDSGLALCGGCNPWKSRRNPMKYAEAVQIILTAAMAVLAAGTLACLVRAVIGPTNADRLIAANMTGTQVIVLVCLHAARTGEHAFTDVALIFAMFSFLGAAVLVRIVTERRKDR